jgi:hypothetical protein
LCNSTATFKLMVNQPCDTPEAVHRDESTAADPRFETLLHSEPDKPIPASILRSDPSK